METTSLDLLLRSRRSHKPPAQRKCRFWWCPKFAYGAGDLCVGHLRNKQRNGHPLAGKDAPALYTHVVDELYPLLRSLIANCMYVDDRGAVMCVHCKEYAGKDTMGDSLLAHLPSCPVEKAREILLRE